jgi:hypothetical protein
MIMAEYRVHWVEKIQVWTDEPIEAKSKEEAIKIAKNGGVFTNTDPKHGTEEKYWAELI